EAKALLDGVLDKQPVLVRISAAKRLRDAAEARARRDGAERVQPDHLDSIASREGALA
ncbi:MAG: chlorophyllide reductase subunit Z, partial [Bosea sp. (in: a-proteobacteria)]|nr:chlorophyllide reductase subunit Z [Bosea sp. (in: a-proteobacteria)]